MKIRIQTKWKEEKEINSWEEACPSAWLSWEHEGRQIRLPEEEEEGLTLIPFVLPESNHLLVIYRSAVTSSGSGKTRLIAADGTEIKSLKLPRPQSEAYAELERKIGAEKAEKTLRWEQFFVDRLENGKEVPAIWLGFGDYQIESYHFDPETGEVGDFIGLRRLL